MAVLAAAGDTKYQALGLLQLPVRFYDDKVPLQEIIWTESGFAQNLHCFQNIFSLLQKSAERYTPVQCLDRCLLPVGGSIPFFACVATMASTAPHCHTNPHIEGCPPQPPPPQLSLLFDQLCYAGPLLHVIYLIPSHRGACIPVSMLVK